VASLVAVTIILERVLACRAYHFPSPLLEIEDVDDVGTSGVIHDVGQIVRRMIGGRRSIMGDEVSAEGAILASAVVIGARKEKKRRVLTVKYKKLGSHAV